MELKRTFQVGLMVFLAGLIGFAVFQGTDAMLWFSIGGGLALVNLFFAVWAVAHGLGRIQKKAMVLGLLLMKSLTFVLLISIILMFLKPVLLPFTLGIAIVIVGATVTAIWESRKLLRK